MIVMLYSQDVYHIHDCSWAKWRVSLLVISTLEVMVELFKVFIPVKPGIHTVTV